MDQVDEENFRLSNEKKKLPGVLIAKDKKIDVLKQMEIEYQDKVLSLQDELSNKQEELGMLKNQLETLKRNISSVDLIAL